MFPKGASPFGRRSCEFSIYTGEAMSAGHVTASVHRGFPNTSGEVIGTPSFEGGAQSSSINSFLKWLQGHSLAKVPPLSETRARVAINYTESRKAHCVPGRKVSLQMSADRFSSDGAENVG